MGCKKIERALINAFRFYGELVGKRPFPFLVVPLIITLLVGPGLITMKYDDDVLMLFTPYNAPSRREQEIARQFARTSMPNSNSGDRNLSDPMDKEFHLPISSDEPFTDIWFNLQVFSDKNLMTQQSWALISEYVKYVYENFTCQVDDWTSDDLSNFKSSSSNKAPYILQYKRDFCNPNKGCIQLQGMINQLKDLLNTTKRANSTKIRLTYPVMYAWGRPFNWGQYIFGVKYDPITGKLKSAKLVNLYFQFQVNNADIRAQKAAQSCVRQLTDYTRNWNEENLDSGLNFYPINEPFVADEVARTRHYLPPYLTATILFITIFIAITSFKRKFAGLSLLGAFMGVLTVGLSLLASSGFLCLCGVHLNFVVMVTPFLVLCVGIDNDFLVTSAWRQTKDGHSSVQRRMGRAFADCGPSLTITSINDILCFGVGYLSETPAVAIFCLHTCVALLFRFIFQLTFFAAVTAYIGIRETKVEEQEQGNGQQHRRIKVLNILKLFKPQSVADADDQLPKKSVPSTLLDFAEIQRAAEDVQIQTVVAVAPKREHQKIHEFFGNKYASFLMRRTIRLITAIIFIIYIAISIYGSARWVINIAPKKLFYDDSPLQAALQNGEHYMQTEAAIGRVYVTNPPDFRNKTETNRFFKFVHALERIDHSVLAPNSSINRNDLTSLWLRQYTEFISFINSDAFISNSDSDGSGQSDHQQPSEDYQPDFYDYLPSFLQASENNRFLADLRFKNKTGNLELDKFQFTVSYFRESTRPYTYEDHVQIMLRWRAVCQLYSDYKAIVYENSNMNSYFDQRLTLAPTCLQTMGIALLSMSFVTALLMPDIHSMFFICLSFLSVDVGVIAALDAWKTDLDPTSMAFVLMTIGFSVYYTARVCYCYQSADSRLSSEEKMRKTMETVGWPILQGAIATLLGVLPVILLQCYMIRVFYRTVILVVLIGLAHGLLFMPVLMAAFDRKKSPTSKLRTEKVKTKSSDVSHDGQSPDTLSEFSSE